MSRCRKEKYTIKTPNKYLSEFAIKKVLIGNLDHVIMDPFESLLKNKSRFVLS